MAHRHEIAVCARVLYVQLSPPTVFFFVVALDHELEVSGTPVEWRVVLKGLERWSGFMPRSEKQTTASRMSSAEH